MRHAMLLVLATALVALAGAQAAYPDHGHGHGRGHHHGRGQSIVFVQTNEPSGNRIVVFDRRANGSLTQAGSYPTGGNGGVAAPGTESDRLASQGSLVYDTRHSLLIAVNAGSDTVTTFKAAATGSNRRTVSSGGRFPASVTVSGRLVYVLNSGGEGIVKGFWITGHKLRPIQGSARSLGLANSDPPDFLTSRVRSASPRSGTS